jgi:hypothetical protein
VEEHEMRLEFFEDSYDFVKESPVFLSLRRELMTREKMASGL